MCFFFFFVYGDQYFLTLDFCKRRFFGSRGLFRSPVLAVQFSFTIILKHPKLLASSDANEKVLLAFNKSLAASRLQQTLT